MGRDVIATSISHQEGQDPAEDHDPERMGEGARLHEQRDGKDRDEEPPRDALGPHEAEDDRHQADTSEDGERLARVERVEGSDPAHPPDRRVGRNEQAEEGQGRSDGEQEGGQTAGVAAIGAVPCRLKRLGHGPPNSSVAALLTLAGDPAGCR